MRRSLLVSPPRIVAHIDFIVNSSSRTSSVAPFRLRPLVPEGKPAELATDFA
jgi:hypothetical protein